MLKTGITNAHLFPDCLFVATLVDGVYRYAIDKSTIKREPDVENNYGNILNMAVSPCESLVALGGGEKLTLVSTDTWQSIASIKSLEDVHHTFVN